MQSLQGQVLSYGLDIHEQSDCSLQRINILSTMEHFVCSNNNAFAKSRSDNFF